MGSCGLELKTGRYLFSLRVLSLPRYILIPRISICSSDGLCLILFLMESLITDKMLKYGTAGGFCANFGFLVNLRHKLSFRFSIHSLVNILACKLLFGQV